MERVWFQAGRPFLLFDFFGGEGVLAGRPTDLNETGIEQCCNVVLVLQCCGVEGEVQR